METTVEAAPSDLDVTSSAPIAHVSPPNQEPLGRMTSDELTQVMCLDHPELVKEIYETTKARLQSETGRLARIDGKATAMLSAVGLSLTVALTLGGQVLASRGAALAAASPILFWCIVGAFVIAVLCGLSTGVFAALALRVTPSFGGMTERLVFDHDTLERAHNSVNGVAAGMAYQRHLTVKLWLIGRDYTDGCEAKARMLKRGQSSFIVFLGALVAVGVGFLVTAVIAVSAAVAGSP